MSNRFCGLYNPMRVTLSPYQDGHSPEITQLTNNTGDWVEAIAQDPPGPEESVLLGEMPNLFDQKEWTW